MLNFKPFVLSASHHLGQWLFYLGVVMKEIKLGWRKVALVDDADFEWLNKYKWCLDSQGYAVSSSMIWEYKSRNVVRMHRVILNAPKDQHIDHKNGNKLDNRRENLRFTTHSGNMQNKGIQKNNTSGYKGVRIDHWGNKDGVKDRIIAQIKVNKKNIHLGTFKTKEEAALAYNEAAKKYFGEFAWLNVV